MDLEELPEGDLNRVRSAYDVWALKDRDDLKKGTLDIDTLDVDTGSRR
jgi:hypothetical protein